MDVTDGQRTGVWKCGQQTTLPTFPRRIIDVGLDYRQPLHRRHGDTEIPLYVHDSRRLKPALYNYQLPT